jgi:glycosyltransferase involved in cell wall biosynthesis
MNPEISIIIPCLNEEMAIAACLLEIKETINRDNLLVEVIVVDNNSKDKTAEIVKSFQLDWPELFLVREEREGYGLAYLKGFSVARGKYIFMADGDGSYDFSEINFFINKLKAGFDFVVGNRFSGKMARRAMSWSHRYVGNPFLSFLVKFFFSVKINDIHCGARAISRTALDKINLHTGGMEFASEMIIKASQKSLKITEVPIKYRPRLGNSKLNSITDGWRHLRFILLYSPLFLFLIPGLIMLFLGIIFMAIFYFSNPVLFGIHLYIHPMFLFSVLIIIGYQLILFSGFSKVYAITHLGDSNLRIEKLFKWFTIEKAGLIGILMILLGAFIYGLIFINWVSSGFSSLNEIKNSVVALTLLVLGMQTFFSAFMFSILGIKEK